MLKSILVSCVIGLTGIMHAQLREKDEAVVRKLRDIAARGTFSSDNFEQVREIDSSNRGEYTNGLITHYFRDIYNELISKSTYAGKFNGAIRVIVMQCIENSDCGDRDIWILFYLQSLCNSEKEKIEIIALALTAETRLTCVLAQKLIDIVSESSEYEFLVKSIAQRCFKSENRFARYNGMNLYREYAKLNKELIDEHDFEQMCIECLRYQSNDCICNDNYTIFKAYLERNMYIPEIISFACELFTHKWHSHHSLAIGIFMALSDKNIFNTDIAAIIIRGYSDVLENIDYMTLVWLINTCKQLQQSCSEYCEQLSSIIKELERLKASKIINIPSAVEYW